MVLKKKLTLCTYHMLSIQRYRDVRSVTKQWETGYKHTKMPKRSKDLGLSAKEILRII